MLCALQTMVMGETHVVGHCYRCLTWRTSVQVIPIFIKSARAMHDRVCEDRQQASLLHQLGSSSFDTDFIAVTRPTSLHLEKVIWN